MDKHTNEQSTLSGILAALYYLSKEAERAELPDVSEAIRNAIIYISAENAKSRAVTEINDSLSSKNTCNVLDFFDLYLRASPLAREAFLKSLSDVGHGGT